MKKRMITAVIVCVFTLVSVMGIAVNRQEVSALSSGEEMRGVWLAYVDYKALGLYNKSESTFRANADKFMKKAKSNKLNAVFFQVRSHDNAVWKSSTFPFSKFLWDKKSAIPYDPLKIMVELAHKNGLELHAWMNPYRLTAKTILDPASDASNQRILKAVEEVMTGYGVDGIHFDDYFYQGKLSSGKKAGAVPKTEKRANVNKMVRLVYDKVKQLRSSARFGISPQGNVDNCMDMGADVKTWLSPGAQYVDYIAPQLYWTDNHSAKWRRNMYTDTLKEWRSLNKNNTDMYIGLAGYMAGVKTKQDPGWKKRSTNLALHLRKLRSNGCQGFLFFSAQDLSRSGAKKEVANLKAEIQGIPFTPSVSSKAGKRKITVKWSKVSGASGYVVYRSAKKAGSYKAVKTIKKASTVSYTNKKLKKKKAYYFKVRAYKMKNGKRIYSSYSSYTMKRAK